MPMRSCWHGLSLRRRSQPSGACRWCGPGGLLVLYAGEPATGLERVAEALAASPPRAVPVPETNSRTLLVFEKLGATPERFPRRPGLARKRPLA